MKAVRTSWRPAESESDPAKEVQSLRRTLRDVVALSALPSIWVDCDLPRSIQNLADVLRAALRAMTVCVRVKLPDGSEFSTAASNGLSNSPAHCWDALELLDAIDPGSTELVEIPKFNGSGPLNALPYPVFFDGRQIGCLVACYKGDAVPPASGPLLLQVAANQIVLLLQRHKDQEERLARKLAEKAVRTSEAQIQSLLTLMPAAVYACDAEGRFTFYNRRAVELWGLEPRLDDDQHKFCAMYKCWFNGKPVPPEDTPMAVAVREGKAFRNLEPTVERSDGTRLSVLVNIDPIVDCEGRPAGAIVVFQDVTPLKRVQEELKSREEHLRTVVENTPECVKLVAEDGTLLAMNGAGLCMVEADSAEQVIGGNIYDLIAPEYRSAFRAMNERVCAGSKELLEYEIIGLRGTRRWMETHAAPIMDRASGRTVQLAVTRNITERRNSELELRRKNGQLAAFLETAAVGLHRVGPDGIILWANDAELQMLGYSRDEYIGHHISEFHADEPVIDDILDRLSCGEKLNDYAARLKCKDGSIKDVLIDSSVLWEDGRFIHTQCFTRDVTGKKRTEEALRESERRLREILEALPAAVYTTDVRGRITMFNQAAVDFSGRMPEIGADSWCVSWKLFWPDGKPMRHDECPMATALKEGRAIRGCEAIAERPDGSRVHFIPFPTPLRDQHGQVVGAINMLVDISARKQAETALRESEAQLQIELADSKLLQAISAEIVSESNMQALYEKLVDAAARVMHSDFASMQMYYPERGSGELRLLALRGFGPEAGETWKWVSRKSPSSCGEAMRRGERVIVTNVEQCEFLGSEGLAAYRGAAIGSMQSTPLFSRSGELAGMISTHWRQPHDPSERELRLLDILARLAADVIERRRAEMLLRESEEKFRNIFNQSTAGIAQVGLDGRFLLVNQRFCEITGYSDEELRTKTCSDLTYEGDKAFDRSMFEKALRERKPYFIEKRYVRPDGSLVWVRNSVSQMTDADDSVRRMLAVSIDISDQKRAAEALCESKALLESQKDAFQAAMRGDSLEESLNILVRKAIELTGGQGRAAFYIVSPNGKALQHVVGMHEHYAKCVTGYPISGESMACGLAVHTGQPIIARDVEQDPKWEEYRWLARQHNFRACWSFPVRTKDGPVLGTLAMYFQEPCEPKPREIEMATLVAHAATVIISRHQQCAERERAEQALRDTNERLTKVLEIETVGVMFWDLTTGCLVDANDTFLTMMGYSRADVESRSLTWEKFTPPEYHEISRAEIAKFVESGRVGPYEKEYIHKDGSRRWLLFAGSSLGNNQSVEFCVDVSERKNIEQALRKSEQQLAADAEALARLNAVGSRLWQAATIHQGIDEMLDATIAMLGADMGNVQLLEGDALRIVAQRGFKLDVLDFFREVSTCDESACGGALRHGERVVIPDVTVDEACAPMRDVACAAGYRAVQSTPLIGRDGRLRGVISTHWRSPYRPDERQLRHLDLYVRQAADFIERCEIDQALRESEERFRTLADNINQLAWMTDKEGWIFWYNRRWFEYTGATLEQMQGWGWESVHHPDHIEKVKALWKDHLQRGAPWEDTFPLRGADGKFRWFLSRAVPIRDGCGRIVRWFGTNTDVTELRKAQAQLADRAVHLEQLVAVRTASLREAVEQMEEFSYSVSHDLRGPLRAMNAYAGVLLEEYGSRLDETGRSYLEKIQRSSDRMNRLTQEVLAYSRMARSQAQPETVNLERLVRDVIHQHTSLQPPAAEIEIAGSMPLVLGHETTLAQSISNLLNNAVKFVARGIKPHVCVWAERNGKHVRVWFEDNGIGIKPEHQQRIFNMFERVHPDAMYEGTGIGLTIVRKAMEKMGGKVGVESDGQNGSRFWIELRSAE